MAEKKKTKRRGDTRAKLIRAAAGEFRARGFDGTDTNRIARRAGFAPQTFYRWFADKTEIFLAVYRAWEEEEAALIGDLIARGASSAEMANAVVAHHRAYLVFRRSLRRLSVENPVVRKARAQSRLRQLARIEEWRRGRAMAREDMAALLLQLERLSDAIAEGEFRDMKLSERAARKMLTELLAKLR